MFILVHTCLFWHGVFHKQALNQMNNSRQLEGMKKIIQMIFPSNYTQPSIKLNWRRTKTNKHREQAEVKEGAWMSHSNWWLGCSLSPLAFVWLTYMSQQLSVRDGHTHTSTLFSYK